MGVTFSHCKASWSYHGFMDFRKKLAQAEGIDLSAMEGFCEWGRPWSAVKSKLKPLLFHSDCDGRLSVDEMKQVQPRLREIILGWDDGYDRMMGLLLCDGMRMAIAKKEPLEFQ